MPAAILNDVSKCKGCGACALACQEINGLPKQEKPAKLSHDAWTVVRHEKGLNIRQQCMHCIDPTCASVCPVAALRKTPEGPVIYEEARCIGCRYCMFACPFNIPKYDWDDPLPKVQKCIMCYEKRVREGKQPACTTACPTGATKFGDRDALIAEARSRIAQEPDRYVDRIFGLDEVGGTSVLYLSPIAFEEIGFTSTLQHRPYPKLTWEILSKIPNIVSVGGVALAGVYWIVNRRMMMERMRNENDRVDSASGRAESDARKEGRPS